MGNNHKTLYCGIQGFQGFHSRKRKWGGRKKGRGGKWREARRKRRERKKETDRNDRCGQEGHFSIKEEL